MLRGGFASWFTPHRVDDLLLHELADATLYGLQLRDRLEARAGLDLTGLIYVHLHRLERSGLVTSWEEPGGPERGGLPRRVYRITAAGRDRVGSGP
jgi:DNA-binding PadR family transcriptional regulator